MQGLQLAARALPADFSVLQPGAEPLRRQASGAGAGLRVTAGTNM